MISESELRELYVTKGLTVEEVAAQFGLAPTTISRRMRELQIEARPRGPVPGKRYGCQHDHDWTKEVAYAVGLMATDGWLGRRDGQLSLTSKDMALLETEVTSGGV